MFPLFLKLSELGYTEEQYKLYQEYKEKNRPKRFEGGPNGGFPPGNFGNPGEF